MESSPQVNRYPQVNLYIETTVHGPRQQGGRWMYLLEFVTRRGDPVTLWKVRDWEAEKENVLIMQALSAALEDGKRAGYKAQGFMAGDCAENGSAFGLYAGWRALIPALDAGETEKNG